MIRDDEPNTPNDLSLFAEQFTEVAWMGVSVYRPLGPVDGRPVMLSGGSIDIGCGCGAEFSGPDAPLEFDAHECPLRGIEWSPDDLWDAINDPGGRRKVHAATIENGIENLGFVVQPVFPVKAFEDGGTSPWFAYTIGLWPAHAEIMCRGYGPHTADVTTGLAQRVVAGELSTTPGVYPFGDDGKVAVIPWSGDPHDFGQAYARNGETFDRVLMVLVDDDGRLPWEGGAHVLQLWGLPEWRPEYEERMPS